MSLSLSKKLVRGGLASGWSLLIVRMWIVRLLILWVIVLLRVLIVVLWVILWVVLWVIPLLLAIVMMVDWFILWVLLFILFSILMLNRRISLVRVLLILRLPILIARYWSITNAPEDENMQKLQNSE